MDWQFEVISEALDCLTDLLKELKGVVIKPEDAMPDNGTDIVEGDDEETGTYGRSGFRSLYRIARTRRRCPIRFRQCNGISRVCTREHCTIVEMSFSTSVLAECIEPLDCVLEPFIPRLYTTFTNLVRDSDSEVRTDSVFGLGELVLHGRELLFPLI
ncbi:hypothetical protein DAPPUDRAFT_247035 [Daphnia pulex]|uniref:Uncharacterized protein n=1 Tax=Daphnia pulex TaxID=6669 RepID=E9GRN0_DAPPU|nr:hypothetical protein DAPPUDRAFT_247035 [Daphnia pulex]|eukprot:EFX77798.1 hypothetical protein DAPPUDRAFT_247035 [Daphnia pulex]